MPYNVRLDIFEGPLDLLLHLIRKNRVDIYDIPIADITEQYLEYLELMKEMNLNVAGEFLVMAATLIHIKSRMLLPVTEEEDDEEEGVDPREELTRRLVEYQRYKEAVRDLDMRLVLGRDVFPRGRHHHLEGLDGEEVFVDVSIFDLIGALKDVLSRIEEPHSLDITVDRFRVADKINYIMERLYREETIPFDALFHRSALRGEIIVTFLAVLELAKLLVVGVHQTEDGIIRIYRRTPGTLVRTVH